MDRLGCCGLRTTKQKEGKILRRNDDGDGRDGVEIVQGTHEGAVTAVLLLLGVGRPHHTALLEVLLTAAVLAKIIRDQ